MSKIIVIPFVFYYPSVSITYAQFGDKGQRLK